MVERRRVRVGGAGQAGLVGQVDAGRGHPAGQLRGDPGVVGGGVRERLDARARARSPASTPPVARRAPRGSRRSAPGDVTIATLAWFLAAARTIDGPPMSISSIELVERDARALGGGRERIQVDDDELERGDRRPR